MTNDIERRIFEHKTGHGSIFCKQYKITDLMYYEKYPSIVDAIFREKQLKNWHKEWKWNLIKKRIDIFRIYPKIGLHVKNMKTYVNVKRWTTSMNITESRDTHRDPETSLGCTVFFSVCSIIFHLFYILILIF